MKTQILKIALIALVAVVGVNGEVKTFWTDKNGKKHYTNNVDKKTVRSMYVEDLGNTRKDYVDTKIIIRQSWNCLCLSDDFTKSDYKVIGDRKAEISLGKTIGYGASLGYFNDKETCKLPVLGDRDCSDNGLREEWTVKQKVKGRWITVGKGWFKFVE